MKPVFRTSMFGFNKEDVTDFMVRQNRKHEEERNQFLAQMELKEKSLSAREAQCREILGKKEEAEKAVSNAKERREELQTALDALKADQNAVREAALFAREEWQILNEENASLRAYREKAKKYDALAGVLTSIISGGEPEQAMAEEEKSAADPEAVFARIEAIPEKWNKALALLESILEGMKE